MARETGARHARKYDGHKAAMRKAAQGQNAQGLFARARRQVGQGGPSLARVTGRTVGPLTTVQVRETPTMGSDREFLQDSTVADGSTTVNMEACDSCSKSVRVKKDGGLYAHKCTLGTAGLD